MRIAWSRVLGSPILATKIFIILLHEMLEILVLVLATLFLAKHPKGKRRYSLRRVKVTPKLTLSTLGSVVAITTGLTAASDSQYRMISVKASWSITGLTAGDGPITVGYAHSDYTVAEI